jgi:putative transcriptional regulator
MNDPETGAVMPGCGGLRKMRVADPSRGKGKRANMSDPRKRLPVADQIRKGLEEAIRHAKGEITLKTTTLEMPDPPPEVGAEELTELRNESGMSQAVFARMLNVSTKTIQSWEQGVRKPSQAALRLIQVFRQNPSSLLEVVGMSGHKPA